MVPKTFKFKFHGIIKVHQILTHSSVDIQFHLRIYNLSISGRKAQSLADVGKLGGGYNFFLQTALPENLRFYNPENENLNSALVAFTTTFPRGFAVEVLQVFAGPPLIAYKFRHWGYKEGPFKGHAPTGEMVEFFGIGIMEVNCHFHI